MSANTNCLEMDLKEVVSSSKGTTIHLGTKTNQSHQYVISEGSTLQSKQTRSLQTKQEPYNEATTKSTTMDTKEVAECTSQLVANVGSKEDTSFKQDGPTSTKGQTHKHNKWEQLS